jgi:hypothetical protein
MLQVQIGQATGVPTIAVHAAGLNPLDMPMMSTGTGGTLLGHGISGALIVAALLLAPYAPYPLTNLYLLLSCRVPVLDLRQFKAKNLLEFITWKQVCIDMFCNNPAYFPDDASKVNWSLTDLDKGP